MNPLGTAATVRRASLHENQPVGIQVSRPAETGELLSTLTTIEDSIGRRRQEISRSKDSRERVAEAIDGVLVNTIHTPDRLKAVLDSVAHENDAIRARGNRIAGDLLSRPASCPQLLGHFRTMIEQAAPENKDKLRNRVLDALTTTSDEYCGAALGRVASDKDAVEAILRFMDDLLEGAARDNGGVVPAALQLRVIDCIGQQTKHKGNFGNPIVRSVGLQKPACAVAMLEQLRSSARNAEFRTQHEVRVRILEQLAQQDGTGKTALISASSERDAATIGTFFALLQEVAVDEANDVAPDEQLRGMALDAVGKCNKNLNNALMIAAGRDNTESVGIILEGLSSIIKSRHRTVRAELTARAVALVNFQNKGKNNALALAKDSTAELIQAFLQDPAGFSRVGQVKPQPTPGNPLTRPAIAPRDRPMDRAPDVNTPPVASVADVPRVLRRPANDSLDSLLTWLETAPSDFAWDACRDKFDTDYPPHQSVGSTGPWSQLRTTLRPFRDAPNFEEALKRGVREAVQARPNANLETLEGLVSALAYNPGLLSSRSDLEVILSALREEMQSRASSNAVNAVPPAGAVPPDPAPDVPEHKLGDANARPMEDGFEHKL